MLSRKGGEIKQGLPSATDKPRHLYPQKFSDAPRVGHMHALSELTEPKTRLRVFAACLRVARGRHIRACSAIWCSRKGSPPSRAETASVQTLLVAVKSLRSQWKAIPSSLPNSNGRLFENIYWNLKGTHPPSSDSTFRNSSYECVCACAQRSVSEEVPAPLWAPAEDGDRLSTHHRGAASVITIQPHSR